MEPHEAHRHPKRPLTSNELLQDRIEADLIDIHDNRAPVRFFFKSLDFTSMADG